MALQAIGGIIFAVGIVLWCGNVFGFFPTFPYAGYVTMAIGGAIFGAGKKMASGKAIGAGSGSSS